MAEQDPVKYFQGEIKRLNYYNSQFLVDRDFNDEQLYHKQMRRLHNRALHTWGIVEGLQVERVQNESKVTVSPGIAIDRLGQEVVLAKRSDALGLDEFGANAQVYVTIRYRDVTDPADKDTSDTQAEGERYRRWTERPEVKASATEPAADAPEVLLAVVKLDGARAVADVLPSKRRYAGSRIGSSADGREFGIYADPAGAWHFFDGGTGTDRLTIDDKGNVGVGTPPTTARLSVLTSPGPYDGTLVDFVVEGPYRLSLRSKAPARDTVSYHFDLVNNLGNRFDDFLVFDRGSVGVGTVPSQKLHVKGTVYSESGGFMFPDGTTQATAAGTATIPARNVSAGTFGEGVGGGNYTFPAAVYWGTAAARTEMKEDAGVPASRSGFFETNAPVNYYPGANSWQHLIEARHSNNANNYALQIAGSFFDQNLYVRKTNNNGAAGWSRFVLINSGGKAGLGTDNPLGPLSIGDSSVAGSDGYIVIGKKTAAGSTRHFRIGFDDSLNFTIGDYGHSNNAGTWAAQLAINWEAPANSLYIDSVGNIGVGTAKPVSQLTVRKDAVGALGPVLTLMNNGGSGGAGGAIDFHCYNALGKAAGARVQSLDDGSLSAHVSFQTKKPGSNDNALVERMRINSGGDVSIGSNAYSGAKLVVDTGGGTGSSLKCEHRGSNFIVRPYSDGGSVTVIENTGGGALLVNPGGGNVGIGANGPTVRLAVGGNGKDVYATDVWVERNLHVQGNETLTQGGRGRLRIGTAWSYVGIYAETSSTNAANDLILGASSNTVRVEQNLVVSGAISCGGRIALKTVHGTYVTAEPGQGAKMRTNNTRLEWEQFTLEMACSREFKENISDLTADEATATLRQLNPVKYDYKGDRAFRPNLGFIAEEMPANLASVDRRTISPFEVVPVLTRVLKEQQECIARLEEAVRALREEVGRGRPV